MDSPRTIRAALSRSASARGTLGAPLYRFPTTLAQQSFWYLDRIEPGNPCWNIAVRFRIAGDLNVAILERSLNEIVRRHEILRTTFALRDDAIVQFVHADALLPIPVDDLSGLPAPEREKEEERRTIEEAALSFDLKTGPLLRARLLKLANLEHMLLITVHHIVSDGWSIGILSDELAAHYEAFASGNEAALPDLPLQFADYAIWKNEQNDGPDAAQDRSYWQTKLANLPICQIPPDHPQPPLKAHRAYILSTVLPVSLTDSLSALARSRGYTLYTLALAALKTLIAHYTNATDVCVGTLLAGRDRVELEPLVGVFINTMILRTDLSGQPTFLELLDRVQETFAEGMAHQKIHFQQVIEALRFKRDPARPTVYSINFIYQRDFVKPLQFAGLSMTPVPSKSPGAIYDLNFFMVERSDGWRLSCEYDCDMYEAASVNRMIGQLHHLLAEIAKDPNRKISQFDFPKNAGGPLPPFVPESRLAAGGARKSALAQGRQESGGLMIKKILSRVYTHLGKI